LEPSLRRDDDRAGERVTVSAGRELTMTTVSSGPPIVVAASGVLDASTSKRFEDAIGDHLAEHVSVVIDVSNLATCDSSGLGALVRLNRRAQRLGGSVAIKHPRQHIADLLMMTGVGKVIEIIPADD